MGRNLLPGQSHYFLGKDSTRWHTHVPHYAEVIYEGLYPGIDLIYYGRGNQLEYDLVVAPGADPQVIELQFEGARKTALMKDGSLRLETAGGELRQHPPVIYQKQDGVKHLITGSYRLTGPNRVSFQIAAYDTSRPLFIDPILSYSSYIDSDGLFSLARDTAGNLYLTGAIPSLPPPINSDPVNRGEFQGFRRDALVTKLDPTGNTMLYSTIIGGELDDLGRDIAIDAAGNAYMVGISSSGIRISENTEPIPFPTVKAIQENIAGSYDVVLAKLGPNGDTLEYSTYLGGSGDDGLLGGLALALDSEGSVYLSGSTNSLNFLNVKAIQPIFGGEVDAFALKIDPTGQFVLYATYLGGANSDFGGDVGVDGDGQAYLAGTTSSTNFPTKNPLQNELAGESDSFVTKLSADGSEFQYSTYLGGSGQDEGKGLVVDGNGQVYLTGSSGSGDFPIPQGAQQPIPNAQSIDAFLLKLDAAGTSLLYVTFVGGGGT